MYTDVDVVVIGAGQAGLASAHELRRRGMGRFVVLDTGAGPGGAWRERWDSLTLGRAHGIADLPFDLSPGPRRGGPVRADTTAGRAPRPVVENTGIPSRPEHLEGVAAGRLVSRGPLARATAHGVVFGESRDVAKQQLVVPDSRAPQPGPAHADVIFFNTGFRPALGHLAPLRPRKPGGGIRMRDEVAPEREPRVPLAGYGSTASTVGATRAGRDKGRAAAKLLTRHP